MILVYKCPLFALMDDAIDLFHGFSFFERTFSQPGWSCVTLVSAEVTKTTPTCVPQANNHDHLPCWFKIAATDPPIGWWVHPLGHTPKNHVAVWRKNHILKRTTLLSDTLGRRRIPFRPQHHPEVVRLLVINCSPNQLLLVTTLESKTIPFWQLD